MIEWAAKEEIGIPWAFGLFSFLLQVLLLQLICTQFDVKWVKR
jgi:hypothetical protein